MKKKTLRSLCAVSFVFARASTPRDAEATEETKQRCIQAAEDGQRLRDQGRLLDARAKLAVCMNASCPSVVSEDCQRWLTDVEDRLPSIVLNARSASGGDAIDVRVSMDGQLLVSRLDGRAISVDPGAHVFRFEASGRAPVETRVLLTEGERRRAIGVRFGEESASAAAKPPRDSLLLPGVFAGVAAASAVGFAVFGLKAQGDYDDLRTRCRGACTSDVLETPRREALVADILLGVSVVSLAAAAWLFFSRPSPGVAPTAFTHVASF